jgi:hypothetical protein
MAARKITTHESAVLDDLRYAVHGICAPFACGGTLVPDEPLTLRFKDQTEIAVLRAERSYEQERLLQPLVARCSSAPFGKGRQTRYNRLVRDALQLKAEGGAFAVLNFDPEASGILKQVRRELLPQDPAPLTAELYTLNIYARDGHFVPHKDTPRGSDMIGTLVVCLPSHFSNGALVVKHQGVLQMFDWDSAIEQQTEATRLHWAAFFGDVDHQIDRVWSGLRVTLTYLLRRGEESEPLPAVAPDTLPSLVQDKLHGLLADRRFLSKGGTLAFPCSHLYHQDARFQRQQPPLSRRTVTALKGRDHMVAAAALAEGLETTFCPYMIETCADETWQLEHLPTEREEKRLKRRMDPDDLEKVLAIRGSSSDEGDFGITWVEPPPHFNGRPTMYPRGADPDPELPALAHLHECEYSVTGYFGNEGSDTDLYTYGALHVTIPPYGEGPRVAAEGEASEKPAPAPRKRAARKKRS